jgi:membrane associated rhomboid family serine protease
MTYWRMLPMSHRFLLALSVFYFVNAIGLHGALTGVLALIPSETIGKWQYWRFLTYPFAIVGWSILPASIVLYFFAPEVEQILSTRRFVLTLLMFTVLHAVVYTPLLLFANAPLAGPQSLALMVLTMYVYLYPSGEAMLFGMLPLRASVLLALIIGIALIEPLASPPVSPLAYIHVLADELFGVMCGFMFAYLYFGRASDESVFSFSSKLPSRKQSPPAPRRTPSQSQNQNQNVTASVGFSPLEPASLDEQHTRPEPYYQASTDDNGLDEERLNEILDKISASGQSSLTNTERQFLKDYANKL